MADIEPWVDRTQRLLDRIKVAPVVPSHQEVINFGIGYALLALSDIDGDLATAEDIHIRVKLHTQRTLMLKILHLYSSDPSGQEVRSDEYA